MEVERIEKFRWKEGKVRSLATNGREKLTDRHLGAMAAELYVEKTQSRLVAV